MFEVEGILESPMQRWPEGEMDIEEGRGGGRFDEVRWMPFQDPPAPGGGRRRGRGGKGRGGRGEGGKWEVIRAGYRTQERGSRNRGSGHGGGFRSQAPARGGMHSVLALQNSAFIQSRLPLKGAMRKGHTVSPPNGGFSESVGFQFSRLPQPLVRHAPGCPLHQHHQPGQ